jgi:hypothetical protein
LLQPVQLSKPARLSQPALPVLASQVSVGV